MVAEVVTQAQEHIITTAGQMPANIEAICQAAWQGVFDLLDLADLCARDKRFSLDMSRVQVDGRPKLSPDGRVRVLLRRDGKNPLKRSDQDVVEFFDKLIDIGMMLHLKVEPDTHALCFVVFNRAWEVE